MCLNCKTLSNLCCVTTKGRMYFFVVFTSISDPELSLENIQSIIYSFLACCWKIVLYFAKDASVFNQFLIKFFYMTFPYQVKIVLSDNFYQTQVQFQI